MKDTGTPRSGLGREPSSFNRRALLTGLAAAMLVAIAIGALVYTLVDHAETADVVALVSVVGLIVVLGVAFNELRRALVIRGEQSEEQRRAFEAHVAERTADLEASRLELLGRLAKAAEYRDEDTHEHTERVGEIAEAIGRQMGICGEELDHLRLAAPLHDVGKIGVADSVLRKPGRLDPEEWIAMQWHTQIGAQLLAGSASPALQMGEEIALSHHEHWDGDGYPFGLSGEDIPRSGRIVAVADVFDALTHDRPYKKAWSSTAAIAHIIANRGRQFDPAVVDAFCCLYDDPRAGRFTALVAQPRPT